MRCEGLDALHILLGEQLREQVLVRSELLLCRQREVGIEAHRERLVVVVFVVVIVVVFVAGFWCGVLLLQV